MAHSTTNDLDKPGQQVLSPSSLCHVVLRTSNYKDMVDFYTTCLGGYVVHGNSFISFITYNNEHHRIAIINVPGTAPKQMKSRGLEHIAFGFSNMHDLLLSYQQRKERGIEPVWCVNHGPTTSIYYRDPDRNMLETQIDNFDTFEATNDFMNSPAFEENPIGVDFNVEKLVRRLQSGEDDASLKKRPEIGPRAAPDLDAM
ncbi:unnamed protein product [Zymoseptoria tritici ST99CH_1A5]|uniref:VOC domain-containing protein n=3 Tax=Zymoseptoria tritici TaxID=1047171 RepID=A0A1X7S1W4_ZYMT9|nr:unnamed protein product [Zymoseptoria tritici ST99CH_3D7]SMR57203.1 unnamed protein product [Zymoseptoria tritici ST99CH_1E4]SMR60077.1 unnamed protein product [Zymoseptoria tritici ST99CH_3D1]SMY27262.1 unnamed protein product [Zymoseptoria tritici ST99CH_1A5]